MPSADFQTLIQKLQATFDGELYFDNSTLHQAHRRLYATDASVYQEMPLAVALPRSTKDIQSLIKFADNQHITLIPRAAGTSLAGQVVGNGLVVDISKYFDKVLEINPSERWVRVQPGVIRDDLNKDLKPHDLLFGPETSTANRAMIGGMIGNNSCGLHSVIWGSVRHHLLEVKAILADGNEVVFGALTQSQFDDKCAGKTTISPLEQQIYQFFRTKLSDASIREQIVREFPKSTVARRNTGYAVDALLPFFDEQPPHQGGSAIRRLNLCNLIAGSEGTLCFVIEAKLNLVDVPPAGVALVCVHTHSIREALEANLIALQHHCSASELADDFILELAKTNVEQAANRAFVVGNPKAILMVELFAESIEVAQQKAENLIADLKNNNFGYAYPVLFGDETAKAWNLRKAGLGILSNIEGPEKPVNLIEDFGVDVQDLPQFIDDLDVVVGKFGLRLQHSAHAGAGEVHSIPMMNLKSSEGQRMFREVLKESAALVKSYGGSLSGEHGDGRLRGEFIPMMVGQQNYELFKELKKTWDSKGVFNRGKITDTPPMNEFLRYEADTTPPQINTIFRFDNENGLLGLAEKCSGSGDCRKTHLSGGTMCPSFMATRSERDTTRARANMLRHFYTNHEKKDALQTQDLGIDEVKEVLDLCLSCKACKSECPTSVDVAKMKAEFTQQYYDKNGIPFRTKIIGNFTKQMRLASLAPWLYNAIIGIVPMRRLMNRIIGFHPNRTMPKLGSVRLKKWFDNQTQPSVGEGRLFIFCDEFTNYNDVEIGKKTVLLLQKLGYEVHMPTLLESGRTYISKGLIREAQTIATQNVELLKDLINDQNPLIGIEPSAILTFRDEYIDLVPPHLKAAAQHIAQHTYTIDEWFAKQIDEKKITSSQFKTEEKLIKLHSHCYQKALSSQVHAKKMLSLPTHYKVQLIPSGCCGMAGSFGYEKEHYDVSMNIGELVLFPTVRQQPDEVIIAAAGTSCRHQIKDGTGRVAQHPVEILYEALIET